MAQVLKIAFCVSRRGDALTRIATPGFMRLFPVGGRGDAVAAFGRAQAGERDLCLHQSSNPGPGPLFLPGGRYRGVPVPVRSPGGGGLRRAVDLDRTTRMQF